MAHHISVFALKELSQGPVIGYVCPLAEMT